MGTHGNPRYLMKAKRALIVFASILIFLGGVAGGYVYFSKVLSHPQNSPEGRGEVAKDQDFLTLRIYYPIGDQCQIEERRPPKREGTTAIPEAIIEEYLKGSAVATIPFMPRGVKLLGVYQGTDGMLYINLSEDFRRNFKGDAFAEFLLLKGMYMSLMANMPEVQDVKIILEGKEIETLGGHFFLSYPLKELVAYEY